MLVLMEMLLLLHVRFAVAWQSAVVQHVSFFVLSSKTGNAIKPGSFVNASQ